MRPKLFASLLLASLVLVPCLAIAQRSDPSNDPSGLNDGRDIPTGAPGMQVENIVNDCEKWSNTDTGRKSGKICTELIEGIPCFTLPGGNCTPDNCAKPPSDTKDGICKSVITASGLTGIQFYVAMIYTYASWVIGITAVLVLIFSGIEIAMGGANAEGVGKAKKRIYQALAGIAFFYLIGMILKAINPNFFQ